MTIFHESPPLLDRGSIAAIARTISEATCPGLAMPPRATLVVHIRTLTGDVKRLLPEVSRERPEYARAQGLVLQQSRPCTRTSHYELWQYSLNLAHAAQALLDVAQQEAGPMPPTAQQHAPGQKARVVTDRAEVVIDFDVIGSAVACARATPPPPKNDDILFTGGGESPLPSVADQIKDLLAELPPLLTACQDMVAAWEDGPQEMALRVIQDGHDLIERRPFAPNAEQAHTYLQQLARNTAAFAVMAYRDR